MALSLMDAEQIAELNRQSQLPTLAEIEETFGLFDDWQDRYRYVIELGRDLAPLPPMARNEASLVKGCQSQVWLQTAYAEPSEQLFLAIDSDAHIVRGLAAILTVALSGLSPAAILRLDPVSLFESLGLLSHLSPSRGNGLRSMVAKIHHEAGRLSDLQT